MILGTVDDEPPTFCSHTLLGLFAHTFVHKVVVLISSLLVNNRTFDAAFIPNYDTYVFQVNL